MNSPHNLRRQAVSHTETVHDMSARVLANGGEPNCATEKLARAFRASVRVLMLLSWSDQDFADHIEREAQR
jgi:hypothetical protein